MCHDYGHPQTLAEQIHSDDNAGAWLIVANFEYFDLLTPTSAPSARESQMIDSGCRIAP
jgi:hypothetical protein